MVALNKIEKVENRVTKLESENEKLLKILTNQQKYLESLDAGERQRNAVVLGLPEKEMGNDDTARMTEVWKAIGGENDAVGVTMKRLGNEVDGRNRPILITFPDVLTKNRVLEKAKKLKTYEGTNKRTLNKVFIKKDRHPTWRKEHARLNKVVREEKEKPENADANIFYD